MKKYTYVDPPRGHAFGFPKCYPSSEPPKNLRGWLVENGYPQIEIDSLGDQFYCRFWEMEK